MISLVWETEIIAIIEQDNFLNVNLPIKIILKEKKKRDNYKGKLVNASHHDYFCNTFVSTDFDLFILAVKV